MRVKPRVNAFDVKRVLATGQNPTRFALLELREANRTLGRGGCGGERESGKRFDDGGVEATASGGRGGGGGRIGEEGHSDGGASAAARAVVEIAARVEVKRGHENDEE